MTDHDHLTMLKAAADPNRVAVALGLQGRGSRFFCPLCQPQGGGNAGPGHQGQGIHLS
jgi:hypothetical protein